MKLFSFILLLALPLQAATLTVPGDYSTIQLAHNAASAGDTVRVSAGTYNERVAMTCDGTEGNFINFIAEGTVIMRGFDLTSSSYVRIIGFEITHNSTTYSRAIVFNGTCSNVEILNNNIHDIYNEGGAIRARVGTFSYVTVRGNTFDHIGFVEGVWENGNGWAIQIEPPSHHWLIEYNTISRCGDFVNVWGANHIIRNNWIHDYDDSYFSSGGGHVDTFQPFFITNQVYEANFCGDNVEEHSHFLQIRDPGTNIVFRGNVGYNFGSYALQAGAVDGSKLYNNSYFNMGFVGGNGGFNYNDETGDLPLDNRLFNNVFHTFAGGTLIDNDSGTVTITASHNLGYSTASHASLISTSDPLFVSTAGLDFTLQSGSPARDVGRSITTVNEADGSGTSFDVADPKAFIDGWGLVEGDLIKVWTNAQTRITGISGSTITVSASVTWTNGAPVFWRNQDTTPDLGAYDYGTALLTGAEISNAGNDYTVTTTGAARKVVFYQDGIPHTTDTDSPYTATISSGTVTAEALPLYAQPDVVVAATEGEGGEEEPPTRLLPIFR